MKKFLVLVLSFVLLLSFAACDDANTEAPNFSNEEASSKAEISEASSEVSSEASSEVSSEASSEASSDDVATETVPEFIAPFVSIGTVDTKVKFDSPTSVALTGVDTEMSYGAVVLYTAKYGKVSADSLKDCAVAVFDYNAELFGYAKIAFYAVGEAVDLTAPEDGFIIAAHTYQTALIDRLNKIDSTQTVFPHGLHLYTKGDYTITKLETAPQIDGDITFEEWQDARTEIIDAKNISWSYAQFETNNYYATAQYYTAYDDNYIYLAVIVDSPYHYCPITPEGASDMWQYECIQVKVSSERPDGEYIAENFDHATNQTAVKEGVVRSYGFAANDENQTCYYEGGITTEFTGLAACKRDDENQLTYYEVAIPFAEFDITPELGTQIGLTFSINSTNEEDVANKIWKNITLRNGGGVIGRNDWSKIPVVTLG